MAKEKKGRKFGRNAKRPSNANQPYRTAANLERKHKAHHARHLEKRDNPPAVPRGTARKRRRATMTFEARA